MGFPFLTGFYSKDVILEVAYGSYSIEGKFAHWLGCFAAFFTAFYSIRLLCLTFLKPTNASKQIIAHAHESPLKMAVPLFILSIASIFIGYLTRDMMIGLGTDFWGNALFVLPENLNALEAEWIDTSIKIMPLFFSLSGALLAFIGYNFVPSMLYDLKRFFVGRQPSISNSSNPWKNPFSWA